MRRVSHVALFSVIGGLILVDVILVIAWTLGDKPVAALEVGNVAIGTAQTFLARSAVLPAGELHSGVRVRNEVQPALGLPLPGAESRCDARWCLSGRRCPQRRRSIQRDARTIHLSCADPTCS